MKTYKKIGFGPRKRKKGFTLIELLIVMVILAILAGVVVMAVGGVFGNARERAYDTTKDELKNAVAEYASRHSGDFPYTSTANITLTSPAGTYYIINIGDILTENEGVLASVPDSVALLDTADNCDGGLTCTASNDAHYVWLMDAYGNIYSQCDDENGGSTACDAEDEDGFMTVYP